MYKKFTLFLVFFCISAFADNANDDLLQNNFNLSTSINTEIISNADPFSIFSLIGALLVMVVSRLYFLEK